MFDLKLLGPPVLLGNGKPVRLHQKHLALLAFLAMERGRSHERVFLSDLLWPGVPLSRADNSLRQALNSLRKIQGDLSLPPLFVAVRGTVALRPDPPLRAEARDLLRPPASCPFFHDPEDCPECEARMQGVLREIRGPFMEGFSLPDCEEFENWIVGTREELLVRVRWIMDRLLRLNEKRGDVPEALRLLDRALAIDPLDEACHGRKMLLLAEGGNTLAALQQFEICRKALREQLGTEPDPETRAILEKIRASSPEKRPPFPASRGPVFPDLSLSPEWRPATALSLDLAGEGEEESGDRSDEIRALLARAASKAETLGGTIGRIRESSLLCWFGTSGETEGAARRAARAALEIRRLVLGGPGKKSRGIAFAAGIHSGRILRGDPSTPPDPTGSVSRSAMALSMQTEAGSILLSESASRLLKGQFRLEEAGEIRVLGHRIRGMFLQGPSVESPRKGPSPPLFGRDPEFSLLSRFWAQKRGGTMLVEGEAGIGKTALLQAFLDFARSREAEIRHIECDPQSSHSPFFPVIRMLRGPAGVPEEMGSEAGYARLQAYVRAFDFPDERTAVALLGSFFSFPPHPDFPVPNLPSSPLREETTKLLLSILRFRALEGRALYAVEDLHWADASTGELLRRILSDSFFTEKVVFLLTIRTGESPPWLATLPDLLRLRLSPLDPPNSRRMVRSLCAAAPFAEEEMSRILAAADGVPLFLEELTRGWIEEGQRSPEGGTPALPATLSEVLASRLDRLGDARLLLHRAAVYGRTVPLELLRVLSPEPEEVFDDFLDRAVRSELVRIEADPSGDLFAFRHALIAEVALRSLPGPARSLLHGKIGETLRDLFPARAFRTPELVAQHFEGAGEWDTAIEWYEKSVRKAYLKGSFPEAETLVRKALALLDRCLDPSGTREREIRLLNLHGNILTDLYGYGSTEGPNAFRKALSLVGTGAGISDESIYSFFGFWNSLYGGAAIRESRKGADALLRMIRENPRPVFRVAAFYADGSTAFWEGRCVRALESNERCLALGTERSGEDGAEILDAILVQAASYRLWNLWFLGRYRSAMASLELMLAQASGNVRKTGQRLTFAAGLVRYLRQPLRLLSVADSLLDSIRTMKTEGWLSAEQGFRGWAMVMTGDRRGLPLILKGLSLSRHAHRIAEIKYVSMLSEAYLALGETRKCRGLADSALRFSKKSGTAFFDAELWRLKGEAALLDGRREEAREWFGNALEVSRRQGARALELRAATSLGRFLGDAGKRKEALALFFGLSELLEGPESDPSLPDIREALEIKEQLSP